MKLVSCLIYVRPYILESICEVQVGEPNEQLAQRDFV
jgi:hypothetical protein